MKHLKVWDGKEYKLFFTKSEAEQFCIVHKINFDQIKPLYEIK